MFVIVFRDKFSTFYQSFIVFVVREGVTVCNPKTDSNSEFGGPNTAEERERCAGEAWWPKAMARLPRVEAVCHTAQPALVGVFALKLVICKYELNINIRSSLFIQIISYIYNNMCT